MANAAAAMSQSAKGLWASHSVVPGSVPHVLSTFSPRVALAAPSDRTIQTIRHANVRSCKPFRRLVRYRAARRRTPSPPSSRPPPAGAYRSHLRRPARPDHRRTAGRRGPLAQRACAGRADGRQPGHGAACARPPARRVPRAVGAGGRHVRDADRPRRDAERADELLRLAYAARPHRRGRRCSVTVVPPGINDRGGESCSPRPGWRWWRSTASAPSTASRSRSAPSIVPLAVRPDCRRSTGRRRRSTTSSDVPGTRQLRADYSAEAQAADERAASLLRMPLGQPVLVTWSTSFTAAGRVVELASMTYRGDCYRFRSTLRVRALATLSRRVAGGRPPGGCRRACPHGPRRRSAASRGARRNRVLGCRNGGQRGGHDVAPSSV